MEKLLARALAYWWIVALAFGLLGNIYLAVRAFELGSNVAALVLIALAIGCVVLLFRTYKGWDEVRRIFKR